MMRFGRGIRLVNANKEGVYDELSTAELLRQWSACMRRIERDDQANPVVAPVWCALRALGFISRESLDQQDRWLWKQICGRHKSILAQHLEAAGGHADPAGMFGRILSSSHAALRQPTGPHDIVGTFWRQATIAWGAQPRLKAKYFLLAWVEEITDASARAVVLWAAYGIGAPPPQKSVRERRALFEAGCWELRGLLLGQASALKALTYGSVSAQALSRIDDPVPYLEYLLLPRAA